MPSKEHERLNEEGKKKSPIPIWYKWGPYVADRSWATVREDYSPDGNAWAYFPFEKAIDHAYRWGEDGIAGFCDRYQVFVFAPAFWNGKDPILKERLFGLSSQEGNHGEDVKEYYFYLDGTPSHSYMHYLYKYPQHTFPYEMLREENKKRGTADPEFELVDTGIFSSCDYFDINITYAKISSEDFCVKIEAFNRSNEERELHVIPQMWFRNQWSFSSSDQKPEIFLGKNADGYTEIVADDSNLPSPPSLFFDYHLGKRYFYASTGGKALFTENESRRQDKKGFYKDAFHRHIIHKEESVNPQQKGTKAGIDYHFPKIAPKSSITLYFRLSPSQLDKPFENIESVFALRKKEADEFYESVHPKNASKEEKMIQRQAWAGLLWSKQIYLYDVNIWLKGDDPNHPPPLSRFSIRNVHWRHLNSMRVLIMPDKWEYPWFAAWDLAFHAIALAPVDMEFAKDQLWLLLFDQFQHPNGQLPACEWDFSDLNPPVHAWAVLHLFNMEKNQKGQGDLGYLERCFHKLLMNFTWWVNRVDAQGNNVFEGGFLGLDNITVIDRSDNFKGELQQSDGTGWMALFSLNLMRIALILAETNKVYESLAIKFFEHFVYIAHAMKKMDCEMWNEKDGFFYDALKYPEGSYAQFRVRSLVGIIPIYAIEVLEQKEISKFPDFYYSVNWFIKNRPYLVENCIATIEEDGKKKLVLSIMKQEQLKSVLKYIWDKDEFRALFGLRSLSKYHEGHPFHFEDKNIGYEPAESLHRIKGGNSNWRGPIWMPANYLLLDALKKLSAAYKKTHFLEEVGVPSFEEMAKEFSRSLIHLFEKDKNGKRPFWGSFSVPDMENWENHLLFHEYFHPDTGKGLGAIHQTGWTALVANIIEELYPSP